MLQRTLSRASTNKGLEQQSRYPLSTTKLEQDFDLGESLGQGGFGQIIKAKRKCDDIDCAIKIIKFDSNKEDAEKIKREAKMLSQLHHNNIVRYFSSWVETAQIPVAEYEKMKSDSEESLTSEVKKLSQQGYMSTNEEVVEEDIYFDDSDDDFEFDPVNEGDNTDEDDDIEFVNEGGVDVKSEFVEVQFLFIQMELCEKRTLRTVIDNHLCLEEIKIAKYFKEICEGLSYIHRSNIVHRDLKPGNIFLTSDDVIKIGDFGLSKQVSLDNEMENAQSGEIPQGSLTSVCGTSVYIAPEMYSKKTFDIKADIYSLGVTYFEMCSKPMTVMEQVTIFPLKAEYLKTLNFSQNNSKKKFLIKNMLHLDHTQRPTCDDILKILNSDKSVDEIKEIIQQRRSVPHQHYKTFEKELKSNSWKKINLRTFFLTEARDIFELHGAQYIPMPTFVPSFYQHSDNLTTMINSSGNFTSITDTSRIPFCYYVAKNSIKKMRRYSIGTVFKEGLFSPTELQECIFQAVTPEVEDHVTDAEMFYIVKQICDKIYLKNIHFVINHGGIYSIILRHCKIATKDAAHFTQILMNAHLRLSGIQLSSIVQPLAGLEINAEVRSFLSKMMRAYNLSDPFILLFLKSLFERNDKNEAFEKIDRARIMSAFNQLEAVFMNLLKFGIKAESILFLPLLTNMRHSTGITFRVLYNGLPTIASGGRIDSVLRRCQQIKKKKPSNISAVEVSFNVESILQLMDYLNGNDYTNSVIEVTIIAEKKSMGIALYRELLDLDIQCEIVAKLVTPQGSNQRPLLVIQLSEEYAGTVYSVKETGFPWTLNEIFKGSLRTTKFSKILKERLKTRKFFRLGSMSEDDMLPSPLLL